MNNCYDFSHRVKYGKAICGHGVQGRLLFKDSPNGGDYLWDGWRMVKKQAWPWGGFGETVEYVWGRDLSGTMEGAGGVGGLLAVRVDGVWHFPLYDHSGIKRAQSPSRKAQGDRDFKATPQEWSEERYSATQRQLDITAYVSESGAVSAEYEYDPFGKVIAHTGRDFDFQFSTKFHDPDIDMYYYGYRYYSPELRRWASPDPIGEAGGANYYLFVDNDSVNEYDYLGLLDNQSCKVCVYNSIHKVDSYTPDSILVVDALYGRHTWLQIEAMGDKDDEWIYKGRDDIYSFGPRDHMKNKSFVRGVPGGFSDPIGYHDFTQYHVIKKCWPGDECACKCVRSKLGDYPEKFSIRNYCTIETLRVMRECGFTDVPDGVGDVYKKDHQYLGRFPNPVQLASQILQTGGVLLDIAERTKPVDIQYSGGEK